MSQAQHRPSPSLANGRDEGNEKIAVGPETSIHTSKTPAAVGVVENDDRKRVSWSRLLNPLKARSTPPVPDERQACREQTAPFFSRLVFQWITPLMHVGYQRPLESNDIWLVNPERSIELLEHRFKAAFEECVARGDKQPLLGAIYSTFKRDLLIGAVAQLMVVLSQTIAPFTLRFLINFATEAYDANEAGTQGPSIGYGVGIVIVILALQVIMTLSINNYFYLGMTVGGETRAVLMSMIFAKALRLSGRARVGTAASPPMLPDGVQPGSDEAKQWYENMLSKDKGKGGNKKAKKGDKETEGDDGWSNGRILNLMSTDTWRIDQASGQFMMVWGSPLSIIMTIVLLLINLNYSALPGLGILVLSTPALAFAIRSLYRRRGAINKITDERVGLTQEILQSIRFVKYFSWETSFLQRLNDIRRREIRAIQILLAIRDGVNAISMSMPVFASMVSFVTYSLSKHVLSPAPIFSSLALFNSLRMPLQMWPLVVGQCIDAYASIHRIQRFLMAEESTDDTQYDPESDSAILVRDATFTWEETAQTKACEGSDTASSEGSESADKPFQIPHLNLSLGRKELIAVIGSVGSGKSSLLAALAGDMRRTDGSVIFGASRAFCPQYPWIQNASVRENITFGKDFDREWYDRVTSACALVPDFHMLPDGDRTEIGERGITISGGQKQRVNIARAIYFNADVVLMDDPLSAVDAHVGRKIMDEAICGLLGNKCRVLATHQLHVLHLCDRIIWLDEGRIKAQGGYAELLANNEDFAHLMTLTSTKEEATAKEKNEEVIADEIAEAEEKLVRVETAKGATLMQVEERAVKAVSWDVYNAYLRSSGSLLVLPLVLVLLILSQGSNIVTSLWLSWWTAGQFSLSEGTYIGIYATLGCVQAILMFLFAVSISVFGTEASKVMLKRAITRVLHAPMSFFDTTPLGRITNRFSKDIDAMDNNLTDALRMYIMTIGQIVATLILVLVYYYYFVAAMVPLILIFMFAAGYYRHSARELKRHEAILRSNVFARFSESVYGISTIKAYGLQDHFVGKLREAIDDFDGAYFLTFANQRWLSIRLDCIGLVMVFVLGILVATSRFSVSPSIGGLVLSYMLGIMGAFQFAVRQMAEVENNMNNTERIHHYGTKIEKEAPLVVGQPLPPSWPERGEIVFDRVQMRYRDGLPLVLQDISMHIKAGERIGIVGRTGAGKSSILSTLFRLVEISGGSITIDGVNISKIGLHDLRSRMAIIPQDPTLFKGTIRYNLDPFDEHTDAQLWSALRQAHLAGDEDASDSQKLGLDTVVEEEGLNFSLGQRQLMAFARALVRDAKIIICDEATSSVDFATDRKVQSTMEALKGKTLLCIAHRLRTIIGYDRICVMDHGVVAQLGTPLSLYDQDGIFRSMCEKGGISRDDILESME
ncbi:P-loop containing nucleoside triphosphate hydrolase protein [Xylariales sp. PMI_506]|nr:P-loop containing nucleoside triphosphate hydrolase protein [Xylariales sp. PMI_506]